MNWVSIRFKCVNPLCKRRDEITIRIASDGVEKVEEMTCWDCQWQYKTTLNERGHFKINYRIQIQQDWPTIQRVIRYSSQIKRTKNDK